MNRQKMPVPSEVPNPHEIGTHNWVIRRAHELRRSGCTADEAAKILCTEEAMMPRPYKSREVHDAVEAAYRSLRSVAGISKWPPLDRPTVDCILAESEVRSVSALEALSPESLKGLTAEHVIDDLFPGDPLICVGRSASEFQTRRREEFRGELENLALIVPSPMSAPTGVTKRGTPSQRCLDNMGARHFIVVEFDQATEDEQIPIILHLAKFLPLVVACHSGGKSIHAWYKVSNVPEELALRFFRYAVSLGADPATWTRSQMVRLPGGTRTESGARQRILFFDPDASLEHALDPPEIDGESRSWKIRSGGEAWVADPDEIERMSDPPIVEGLLREREVATIVGAAKTSKTWFALGMAVAIASGEDFLGFQVHQRRVLYLDYELKETTFAKRLSMLAKARPAALSYLCLRGADRPPSIEELSSIIQAHGIEVVFVDSLYRAGWLTEENSNDSTSRELASLQQVTAETGATIVTVDHTAKGGGSGRSAVDASRGASAKGGFFDAILVLRPADGRSSTEGTQVILDPVLRDWPRFSELPVFEVEWSKGRCRFIVTGSTGNPKEVRKAKILEVLDAYDGLCISDIVSATGISESSVRREIRALKRDGSVHQVPDPDHPLRRIFSVSAQSGGAGS